MSNSTIDGKYKCSTCGKGHPTPQSLGGHVSGGCPNGQTSLNSEEFESWEELGEIIQTLPEDRLAEFCAKAGFKPADGDSGPTAAAKAVIQEQDGGKEAYTALFGECKASNCQYGANGFEANLCRKHENQKSAESSPDAVPEAAAEDEQSRADYVRNLVEAGLSAKDAEIAAEERYSLRND